MAMGKGLADQCQHGLEVFFGCLLRVIAGESGEGTTACQQYCRTEVVIRQTHPSKDVR
jgi:hypothetical protein